MFIAKRLFSDTRGYCSTVKHSELTEHHDADTSKLKGTLSSNEVLLLLHKKALCLK